MKKVILFILLTSISIASFAQLITPFTARFAVTQKGGITIIGNTATSCGAASSSCQNHTCAQAHAEVSPGGVGVDNDFVQSYVDIDADGTTFMSSSDSLTLPSCSLISFAGLYWGAGGAVGEADGPNWPTRANAKIKVNNGAYVNITADATFDNNTGYKSYHNFKNITNIVTAAGINARFTIANMPLLNDAGGTTNRWGGWAIVIVYRNDLQTLKNLIVFNGLTNVSSTNTITDIPLAGFLTPPTGPVNFQLGLVTYDGDRGASASACSTSYVGDSLLFKSAGNFVPISDARNPVNDVMNSTLSVNGVATLYRNPLFGNTLGFDADIFAPNNAAKNYIANSATTATIRERTGGETYITQVITSAIDVFEPDDRGGLKVVDLNGGSVVAGDTLEYTATIKNIGSNPSINTYIVDSFPFNCVYVPGSMNVVYGPNAGVKTDASGDDQGDFYPIAKSIKVRIGTGANAVSGGTLIDSPTGIDSTQVKFRVTVTTDCIVMLCSNIIANRFHVVGTGFISGNSYDTGSNPTILDGNGCPVQGTTNTPISSVACQPPTASNNSPVCVGGTINLSVQSSPNATYSWTGPNGFASSVQNPVITNVTAAMAGAYTVTVTVTGTNCVFTATSTSVVVNSTPTITSASSATICSGGTVNIPLTQSLAGTFTWIATDNPNTTGESTTLQNTATLNNTITNTSTVPQTVVYTVIGTATTGSCPSVSQTVNVLVNPVPTMTSADTATICSGGTVSIPLTASTGSTFTWIAANNPNTTGESITLQNSSTLSNTIINNTTVPQTVTYTVTPTATTGGCVATTPQTVTVTVNPTPTMTSAASATICSGATLNIPLTASVASSFTWIAGDNPNTTGESITLQNTSTINNTIIDNALVTQTVTYTVTPTATTGGCVGTTPQTVTVTVNPTPTMTSATTATICSGDTVSIPLTASVGSSFTWVATDNVNTTGESLTTQNTSTLSNTITNNSTVPQTVVYTVTPTSTVGSCPAAAPQTVTVTVNPTPTMTSTNTATICSGDTVTIPLTASVGSTFTWIATNNPNTTGESITLQSSSTLSNTIINNTTVAQTVTYTVTPTATVGGCVGTSPQTVTVTVNPAPTMTSATTATICSGATLNIPLTATIPSTFAWIATDNVNTTGESTTLQNTSTINNTIINNSTVPQTVTYTVTPTANAGGCPATSPQTLTVTVNPTPTMTSANTATICSGGTVSIPLTATVGATFTWIATDNTNTTGESLTTQNTSTLSNTITNNTNVPQVVTYTVTPTATVGGCVGATPQTITVTVNPTPTMTSANTATICSGGTVNIPLTANVPSSFTWVAANNPNTTGESLAIQNTSTINNTITNNSTVPQTVTYTVTPTATTGSCPGLTPQTVTVIVNPAPTMTSATTATICSGSTVTIPLTANIPSSFTWIAANNPNTTGESLTLQNGSPLTNVIFNPGTTPQTVVYMVTPTSTSGGCAGLTPQTVTVTVNPMDSVAFSYSSQTYCQTGANPTPVNTGLAGGTYTAAPATLVINPVTGFVNVSASPLGTYTITYTTTGICPNTLSVLLTITTAPSAVFSYIPNVYCQGGSPNPQPTYGPGASGETFTATPAGLVFVSSSTGEVNLQLSTPGTYTVTNTILAAGGCAASSATTTIVINPEATVSAGGNGTVCSSGGYQLAGTFGGGATSATWTTSGTGSFNNPALTNAIYTPSAADIAAGIVTLTLTTNNPAGPCPSVSDVLTLTINPAAVVDAGANATICSGTTYTLSGTFSGGASSLTWSTSGSGTFDNTSLPNATYTPSLADISAGSVILTTTSNDPAGPCGIVTDNMTLIINPVATVNAGADATMCSSATFQLSGTFGGGATTVIWSTSGTGTFNNATSPTAIYTPSAADIAAGTVTLTLTTNDPVGPCGVVSDVMVLTINPAVVINAGVDATICSGTTYTLSGTFSGGATSLTWSTSGTGTFNNTSLPNAIYTPSLADIAAGSVILTATSNDPAGPCGVLTDAMTLTINSAAVANAGADATICALTNYTVSGTVSGGATSGSWTTTGTGIFFNSNALSTIYNPSNADDASGTVILILTTNNPAGVCNSVSDSLTLHITPRDNASFSYSSGTYCHTGINPTPVITGLPGGTFTSSPSGLVVNAATGTVNLLASALGTYSVYYTTNGPCPWIDTVLLTVTVAPSAVFSYNPAVYCLHSNPNAVPTFPAGSSAGVFSAVPAGLVFVNTTTGVVDLNLSAPGTYTVTNFIAASGGCAAETATNTITINPNATVDAGADATICSSSTYTLLGTIGGGATSSTWTTSGTGTFDNPALPGATYSPSLADITAGTVTLTLTTNDPVGPCPSVTDNMVLTINLAATASAGADATICATSSYTLSGNIGGSATTLTWTTSGTGTFSSTIIPNPTYTPSPADDALGSVTLVITTNDPAGICGAVTDTIVISITPRDNPSFSYAGSTYCQSGVNPTPAVTGLAGGTFSSTPIGLNINPATGTITLLSSAVGTYTVMYLTNGTCPDSSTTSITITPLFIATFSYNGPYCQHSSPDATLVYVPNGSAGTFTAHPAGIIFNATTGTVDLQNSIPGTYTVVNSIIGTGGCANTADSTTIVITPLDNASFSYSGSPYCNNSANPTPVITGIAGGTFSITPGTINASTGVITLPTTPGTYQVTYSTNGACPNTSSVPVIILSAPTANAGPIAHLGCGDTVQLIGSGSSVGSNYIYQWTTLTGNIISGTTNPLALANQSGIYTLTVTDTVTGCVAIDTMTVLGVPAPVASFTTNPNPATGTVPLTVTFTNTSTNANSYLWTFGDGTTSNTFSPTHVFNHTGVYTVVLYAYSGHCIDSSSVIVVVYDAYSVIIPNIFTPNDDGVNDVFYINTTGASAIDVVIFDRWGLKIYEWHTIDGGWDGHNANGVKVSDGTYYYIADVTDGDGKTTQTKGAFTLIR